MLLQAEDMNYVTGYKLETAILGIYEVSTQAVN
jgi:hypothetical protein